MLSTLVEVARSRCITQLVLGQSRAISLAGLRRRPLSVQLQRQLRAFGIYLQLNLELAADIERWHGALSLGVPSKSHPYVEWRTPLSNVLPGLRSITCGYRSPAINRTWKRGLEPGGAGAELAEAGVSARIRLTFSVMGSSVSRGRPPGGLEALQRLQHLGTGHSPPAPGSAQQQGRGRGSVRAAPHCARTLRVLWRSRLTQVNGTNP